MARNNNTIWQWNSRGFKCKRAVLQSFQTNRDRPEIIALQECGKNVKLASYKSFLGQGDNTQVVILAKRNVTILQHELGLSPLAYALVEIPPRKRR